MDVDSGPAGCLQLEAGLKRSEIKPAGEEDPEASFYMSAIKWHASDFNPVSQQLLIDS